MTSGKNNAMLRARTHQMVDQALVEKLAALLKDHTEVRAAYLFGSRARGSHRSTSDVDIAVAFAPATSAWNEVELQEQLTVQLAMPVQVVDLARRTHTLSRRSIGKGFRSLVRSMVAVEGLHVYGCREAERGRH